MIAWDGTRTPLKTALFLVVCLAWLVPGLVGHDPWKADEAVVFGAVTEMLRGGDWLAFRVANEPLPDKAPLFLWVAALFAKLLGGLMPLHDAARLAAGFFLGATLGFLSLACRELMGERAMRVGVLLFIGCLGLLLRAHEMSTDLAGLAGIALALYGFALSPRRPSVGGCVVGLGMGVAFLGDGFLPLGMLLALLAMLPLASPAWRTRGYVDTVIAALGCAGPLVVLWPALLAWRAPEALELWRAAAFAPADVLAGGDPANLLYFARILPWYAWPAWPLAAWTLWRSRRSLAERRELQLPLVAFVAFFLVLTVFGDTRDVNAMPLLLPLALLGVAELDALPRGAASALDWFGMTTFFLLAALIWLGWIAAVTGKPDFMVPLLQREVPQFQYRFSMVPFVLACMLTLVWLAVAARSLRSTRRALVNWTAGITMVWMLAMTLGLPLVDQVRSYRAVTARMVAQMPPDVQCIARRNLGDAQRALLDYFGNVLTVPDTSPEAARCRVLLVQASPLRVPAAGPQWTELWRGSRPGDRHELFVLYERKR